MFTLKVYRLPIKSTRFFITHVVIICCTAIAAGQSSSDNFCGEAPSNNTGWLTICKNDTIDLVNRPQVIIRDKKTNARNMWVFASRFNYSAKLNAVKVKITPKNSPLASQRVPLVTSVSGTAGGHTVNVPDTVYAKNGSVLALQPTATRYLCPLQAGQPEHLTVTVSTGYLDASDLTKGYMFDVEFVPVDHWSLGLETPMKLATQPGEPAVFSFAWGAGFPDTVTVLVASVSAPEVCTTVAVQHRTCPLALTDPEMSIDSNYFSMTASGHLPVRRSEFPDGFFVIVLPRVSDRLCDPRAAASADPGRKKTVQVTVRPVEVQTGYFSVPFVLAGILLLAGCVIACSMRLPRVPLLDVEDEQVQPRLRRDSADTDDLVLDEGLGLREPEEEGGTSGLRLQLSPIILLLSLFLILLAVGGNAVFSSIKTRLHSGDFDMCYSNDLCAHAFGRIQNIGANHILARIPYIGAGVGFIIAVVRQKMVYLSATADGTVKVGIWCDFDLLLAAGGALIMQGVLSAVFAICPSPHIAELDAVFIVFTLTAIGVKLFQSRRGITTVGHYAPLLLCCTMVASGLGIRALDGAWYGWLILASLHVCAAVVSVFQLYVHGRVSFTLDALQQAWTERHLAVESPNHQMNRATAVVAVIANVIIAVCLPASRAADVIHYFIVLLAVHAALYLAYYHLLKLVRAAETGVRSSWLLLLAGLVLLVAGVVVVCGFSTFNTALSAAQSRLLSRACLGASPFDLHDLSHLLLAPALFCLAAGVLMIDDDLMLTPRVSIAKF